MRILSSSSYQIMVLGLASTLRLRSHKAGVGGKPYPNADNQQPSILRQRPDAEAALVVPAKLYPEARVQWILNNLSCILPVRGGLGGQDQELAERKYDERPRRRSSVARRRGTSRSLTPSGASSKFVETNWEAGLPLRPSL